jgi:hypothetical protein
MRYDLYNVPLPKAVVHVRNYPDSICRHSIDRDPAEQHMGAIISLIMGLDCREIYFD